MKIVAYVLLVLAALHAIGSLIGHAPGKIVFSVLIAAVGVVLLIKAKKTTTKA
jgi:hypothetical protein